MSFEIMKRELWQRKEDVNPRFASLFRELAGAADEEEAMGIVIRHWSDFTPEEQRELQRELVANTKGGSIFDKEAAREFFEAGYKAAAEKQPRVVYRDRVVEKKVYVKAEEEGYIARTDRHRREKAAREAAGIPEPPRSSTPAEHLLTHKMHVLMWKAAAIIAVLVAVIIILIVKR